MGHPNARRKRKDANARMTKGCRAGVDGRLGTATGIVTTLHEPAVASVAAPRSAVDGPPPRPWGR